MEKNKIRVKNLNKIENIDISELVIKKLIKKEFKEEIDFIEYLDYIKCYRVNFKNKRIDSFYVFIGDIDIIKDKDYIKHNIKLQTARYKENYAVE